MVFALEPVYGITLAWLIFTKTPTLRMLLGGVLIIVAIVVSKPHQQQPDAETGRARFSRSLSPVVVAPDLRSDRGPAVSLLREAAVGLALPRSARRHG